MSGEAEPRRSVRATKGQHKALDQLEQSPADGPKRRGKKGRKSAPEPEEEPEEEVIRCVCGATEQDEDSGEPWIACDRCGAWQHNICMGMSRFSEDLLSDYFCEICKPENHEELLEGIARGEKPWEERRRIYDEEKKKKKGPKKGLKGKRNSDEKEELKESPAPESKKDIKPGPAGKRKTRDDPLEQDTKQSQKLRKVSENQALPVPAYEPPADLPSKISELPDTRTGAAKLLLKALNAAFGALEKKGAFAPSDGLSLGARAERSALEIERSVHDSHPVPSAYAGQARTLAHNLKTNHDLANRLLKGSLTPPMLAAMSTEEMATKELQRETAELKARAERQSIMKTEEGPRMRRTHKGEELVGDDNFTATAEEAVGPTTHRRPNRREQQADSLPSRTNDDHDPVELPADYDQHRTFHKDNLQIDTKHSPQTDFDINKVFSSVKSPTGNLKRRPSALTGPAGGPGVDPEVDRMLRDDGNESPPYSPSEETDPNVIWRGHLMMNTIADFQATAKHVGGAKLTDTIGLPWSSLIPRRLNVAGRIDEQQAVVYLCSLRYSIPTDVVVVKLEPASEAGRSDFHKLVNYFVSKKRYGVIGDKGVANVRDTYLVPILPGTGNQPEFMLNLVDNHVPEARTEPMLLGVFVYRNDPSTISRLQGTNSSGEKASHSPVIGTPTPAQGGPGSQAHRNPSISAPAFSPTSPQGPFPSPRQGQAPALAPHNSQNSQPHPVVPPVSRTPTQDSAQRQGELVAREILGPYISSPTVAFLLPQAHAMQRKEWELVRGIYEKDTRAREDLAYLAAIIEKVGPQGTAGTPSQPNPAPPAPTAAHAQHHQPPAVQTPIPLPQVPLQAQRTTPIPVPTLPPNAAGPPKQTPVPLPPIPPPPAAATAPPA